jgi:hypothetical protein
MPKKKMPSGPGAQPNTQANNKNRPQDIQDPRKKSDRHKKMTADKWNQ